MEYKVIPVVTLKMIIDSGIMIKGTTVHAYPAFNQTVILDKEGAITLNIDGTVKTYPFPSGAARALTVTSVNGWKFWKIHENGDYNELAHYREIYKELHNH